MPLMFGEVLKERYARPPRQAEAPLSPQTRLLSIQEMWGDL